MKLLFRYLIFVVIPYFVTKLIEIYFRKHANSEVRKKLNKKLKYLPELDTISESSRDESYILESMLI